MTPRARSVMLTRATARLSRRKDAFRIACKVANLSDRIAAPNWEQLKIDVRERIDALAATMSDKCNAPPELKAKLWSDIVLPNVRLLAEFCANVRFGDDEQAGA